MELEPWDNLSHELTSLRKQMDRLWDRFLRAPASPEFAAQEWQPVVAILETKDKLLVTAELPGLEPKDIKLSISDNLLTIKGEKKLEKEEKDEHYHFIERYQGSFQRSLRLPVNIKTDKVDALFDKGVLKITLPKTEEARKKEIEVKAK